MYKMAGDFMEILNYIFNEESVDFSMFYQSFIEKILANQRNSSGTNGLMKTFASIKVLLLNEKFYSANSVTSLKISFKPILCKIKDVFNNNNDNSTVSDNCIQKDLLHIIASLFRITFAHSSQENLTELAEFYQWNMEGIEVDNAIGRTNLIIFRLKILCAIYDVLVSMREHEFMRENVFGLKVNSMKSNNSINECELFSKLIVYSVDETVVQILLYALPQYVKCFKTNTAMMIIWQKLAGLVNSEDTDIKHSRMLLIMCHLIDLFFVDSVLKNKESSALEILQNEAYWNLLQAGLTENDPLSRKQAIYLFKKTFCLMKTYNENIEIYHDSIKKNIWDVTIKNELAGIYSELNLILECLEEQQIHIINQMFEKITKLTQDVLKVFDKCKAIDLSWIFLLHHRLLMHENTQVVKWGLSQFLKLDSKFFSQDFTVKQVVNVLLPALAKTNLYYNDGLVVSEELGIFFEKISQLCTAKLFFSLFIKKLCGLVWSSEALFFVVHALGRVPKNSFWNDELVEIEEFVSKAFVTHNTVIRCGVQFELLRAIVNSIDEKNVPLENFVRLLSKFSTFKLLERGSPAWIMVTDWLRKSYSVDVAKECLWRCFSEKKFSDRTIAFMIFLLFDALGVIFTYDSILLNVPRETPTIYPLTIVCNSLDPNFHAFGNGETLIRPLLNHFSVYIQYILNQWTKRVCDLEHFYDCQVYAETFENFIKTGLIYKYPFEYHVKSVWDQALCDINAYRTSTIDMPSVRIYLGVKFLKILIESYGLENIHFKNNFRGVYLIREVNDPLRKSNEYSRKTKDLQTLWGKMNSEYLEAKWRITEYILGNETSPDTQGEVITDEDLLKLCAEALKIGGYGVLSPVMSVFKKRFPKWAKDDVMRRMIDGLWELIVERRKTAEFKVYVKHFVEMMFDENLLKEAEDIEVVLFKYTDLIFSDPSLAVVNNFIKHIQELGAQGFHGAHDLLCHILAKGIIFGPIQRKDEKLTNHVCSLVESFNICSLGEGYTSNEVRARTVQMILTFHKKIQWREKFPKALLDTLLKLESDLNENKKRYFGDSQVHRVKHRLMQALLILDSILEFSQEEAEKFSGWLYKSLLTENSQPSVKYQQEWLLVRLLLKYPDLLNKFWNRFNDTTEIKTKGLCSLIAILYHLCKLVSSSSWIDRAIPTLLPFCMDQHFEVRLYAQVVLKKLCSLAKEIKLENIIEKYETIHQGTLQSIRRGCQGNAGKNCVKLEEDFYLNIFHPIEHYSLETIFTDLPRLANVGSDEWISINVFKNCGLSEDVGVPLENLSILLKEVESAKWVSERSKYGVVSDNENEGTLEMLASENYQKKMIPSESVVPEGNPFSCDDHNQRKRRVKEGGLVVVASLIDRIPNLGGLARSCEIFGASEYVVGSLKHLENKEFTSLSVTAEKWINVKEVKLQNLLQYLMEMKRNDYKIVGAEQTANSQPLHEVTFPKKTLLLLGNEKEGIPPNLLPFLDICIEIPQTGVIRSLNVHVSGALFMWEYAKQHLFT